MRVVESVSVSSGVWVNVFDKDIIAEVPRVYETLERSVSMNQLDLVSTLLPGEGQDPPVLMP
jgi:hypothetical protein